MISKNSSDSFTFEIETSQTWWRIKLIASLSQMRFLSVYHNATTNSSLNQRCIQMWNLLCIRHVDSECLNSCDCQVNDTSTLNSTPMRLSLCFSHSNGSALILSHYCSVKFRSCETQTAYACIISRCETAGDMEITSNTTANENSRVVFSHQMKHTTLGVLPQNKTFWSLRRTKHLRVITPRFIIVLLSRITGRRGITAFINFIDILRSCMNLLQIQCLILDFNDCRRSNLRLSSDSAATSVIKRIQTCFDFTQHLF